ncbi:sodium/solute symporter [Streptomyces lomondensis]|uniref:Cation acetate symporter n=1 Tax=Streptomyces lomondensis TaxID=68229 RepID=A0ABQ2X3S6_9ACTN|nr:cation acetate symporter [Streptomyces lomondensis]MCF0079858.1 cation acetate symporter [Streptomyces lomondensis]GGW97858.1 cation acetate symporter [Streptomyces lomondensis]
MVTAAAIDDSSLQLTFVLFLTVVVITLFTALLTAPQRDEISEFYLGNRAMSPLRNGLAMCGDYLSAATLLGSTGLVALTGYDGLMYLGGTTVAWMMVLLLIAEPLHRTGKFTLGDTVALRLPRQQRPVRVALAVCILAIATLYLVAQLVGSVALLTQFTGVPSGTTRTLCVVVIGTFVILYASLGGMPGATVIQIIKAVMLIAGVLFTAGWVLHRFDWNPNALLERAAQRSGTGLTFLEPGLRYGGTVSNKLDFLSLELAIVLGLAALPHVLMRLLAPRSSGVLRSSVLWAIGLVGAVCFGAGILGLGATALVGRDTILDTDRTGNASVLLLAHELGGSVLTALLTCLAYLTLLAVAVGLTLAAASSLAHDLYSEVIRKGRASETEELTVARLSGAVIGILGMLLALVAWGANTATLAFLAFAIAASAILPTIIYTLFWRRFSAKGALLSLYGGLLCSVLLAAFSPVVSSAPASFYPEADFAWFPLQNPGIVSIPVGFFLGWLGTVLDKGPAEEPGTHEEFEVRMLVGADD